VAFVQVAEQLGVPEPTSFVLAALGLVGLGLFVRRRRRANVAA
jgi:MYXO-CTERM domain-containing protein